MKTDKPSHGSGKTRFNRGKKKGESWTERRNKAIEDRTWKHGQDR